jgi:two-component system, chemotaxis family, chemotaxis protein CheY
VNPSVPILVVDDDDGIQAFLTVALSGEGYDVQTASNGAAALEILKWYRPRLIYLDMYMPVMNGWTFLQAYQKLAAHPVPIIAASANTLNLASAHGISAFLAKPFDLDELLELVKRFTANDQARV